jgi:hypothetical protein
MTFGMQARFLHQSMGVALLWRPKAKEARANPPKRGLRKL